ncbi:hypothetical protein FO433_03340 [Weissella cibaria]|jgi:hypothetical protein|uniref:Uncharacterized protein n=1 Tax=Weissella cibaria TaxID=137591 RepID=A0A0N9YM58_9LACO|nr:hypothetical protein [Weissella cibaria]ALI33495.1 hypothetical protein AO080_08635 [Weissella cibaria]MBD1502388.1 hypothetical protein [Weissella cibaria]MBU7560540.1 hypothetical protein [Weissella cibaria]MBZ5941126.1 hypothetical protein [Weissella cibaria]MBZ6069822.1 hypothetical protein [Weissella cibaria]
MTFDEFDIELGTVLYLDQVTERETAEVAKAQRPEEDIHAEYESERRKIMQSFLVFAELPATDDMVSRALENLHTGLSDGERTTLLTIRNLHNREAVGNFTEDDAEELEDAVEAAEAYLMNRLAELFED